MSKSTRGAKRALPAAPKPKKRNNRSAGHRYECDCAKELRELGFEHVVTSRSESKTRDNLGVDLMNKEEGVNGRLPYNIQCKNTEGGLSYHGVYTKIQKIVGVINVIFHQMTKTAAAGNTRRFDTLGQYAILSKEDFLLMVAELRVFGKQHEHLVAQLNALRKERDEAVAKLVNTTVEPPELRNVPKPDKRFY